MDAGKREETIKTALKDHHLAVMDAGYHVVMTVLVGSQNYDLDTPNSDYDTYTFVMPTVRDIAMMNGPVSVKLEDEWGHINIKDIRLGLYLLKKTSPNSVEWFATKHKIVDTLYHKWFGGKINPMLLRCNPKNMLDSIGGMSKQLLTRNMPAGKRFSHLLRMKNMLERFYDLDSDILGLCPEDRYVALKAKLDPDNKKWEKECELYEGLVQLMVSRCGTGALSECEMYAWPEIDRITQELMELHFGDFGV